MKKIAIILDELSENEARKYLAEGEIWMSETENNTNLIDSLSRRGILITLPGEVSLVELNPNIEDLLSDVFDHYNEFSPDIAFSGDWSSISIRGGNLQEIRNALAAFTGLVVAEKDNEIILTKK